MVTKYQKGKVKVQAIHLFVLWANVWFVENKLIPKILRGEITEEKIRKIIGSKKQLKQCLKKSTLRKNHFQRLSERLLLKNSRNESINLVNSLI